MAIRRRRGSARVTGPAVSPRPRHALPSPLVSGGPCVRMTSTSPTAKKAIRLAMPIREAVIGSKLAAANPVITATAAGARKDVARPMKA